MDPINRNQPEHTRENLHGKDAIEKIKQLAATGSNYFFCTTPLPGQSAGVRPMNIRQVDDQGNFWFLSASDSGHNQELALDPSVKLYFQGSKHSDFLYLTGRSMITTDRAKIMELWEPVICTWFTEGIDDLPITVIKVVPENGYYWDTKHGEGQLRT